MSFQPGDTFIENTSAQRIAHLWVVISDPIRSPDEVAIVNVTSWTGDQDASCRLNLGDHPFVKHASCIRYREARICKLSALDAAARGGAIRRLERFDEHVLLRIRIGAAVSQFTPFKVRALLERQGFI